MGTRRRITLTAVSALGAVTGLAPVTAHATGAGTIYVDHTSAACTDSGAGAGAAATPYCTPATAIATAVPGSTVLVQAQSAANGYDYALPSIAVSGTSGSPITVRFSTGARVSDMGTGLVVTGQHDLVIDGVAMQGSLVVTQSQRITVSHAYIHQGTYGISMQGDSASTVDTVRVETTNTGLLLGGGTNHVTAKNVVVDQSANGFVFDGAGSTANKVIASTATYNSGAGFSFLNGSAGNTVTNDFATYNDKGLIVDASTGDVIDESTVAQNCEGVAVQNTSTSVSITNNIVSDDGNPNAWTGCHTVPGSGPVIRVDGSSTTNSHVDYNIVHTGTTGADYVWGSTTATSLAAFQNASSQGAHDLVTDPKFGSNSPFDGYLSAGSPAINSGDNAAAGNQPTDYLGGSRTADATVDRGAIEYQSQAQPPAPAPTPAPTPVPTPTPAPSPAGPVTVQRIGDLNRYLTGIAVSKHQWQPGAASAVVLARGDAAPDALAGVPLAARAKGPLLLTDPHTLDPAVAGEIDRVLGGGGTKKTVYVLGGTGAVAPAIVDALTAKGYIVVRYGGGDRYATALQIAASPVFAGSTDVIVATGRDFPDALAAGPLGALRNAPIVLSNDSTLDAATMAFIQGRMTVWSVGQQAANATVGVVPAANRITKAGVNRYETASQVAEAVAQSATATGGVKGVGVASGATFPDALTGGAYAANAGQPLLLTASSAVPPSLTTTLHTTVFSSVKAVEIFGGPSAIGQPVEDAIVALIHGTVVQ